MIPTSPSSSSNDRLEEMNHLDDTEEELCAAADCIHIQSKLDDEGNDFVGFDGFEARDFQRLLHSAGERDVTLADVQDWLDDNESDPGYEVLSTQQIAAQVTQDDNVSSEDEDKVQHKKLKMSTLRSYVDALLEHTEYSQLEKTSSYYTTICMLRESIIKEQHMGGRQLKLYSFFTPGRNPQPGPSNQPDPQPGPSNQLDPQPGPTPMVGLDSDSE
ncbi:hypothetical protein Pcinc_018404 [Petrolisthes cinctipes]|uniref:Uncharacterized protein n=1 Tax=Petrolisthes cinctipes TaxID=88211 RepID=A0AAE1FNR4_PETCI|nr:hypothetical protein Pcinc_018404 [Petrolisthes cinctipes]